jgi:hypothetical protein
MKKNKFVFLAILVIFIFGIFITLIGEIKAAWYVTPASAPISTDTEYCLGLDIGGAGVPAGYDVELEFLAGFDLTGIVISDTEANSEVVFYTGTTNCTGGTARITEDTPTADNDRDAASVSGQKLAITLEDAIAGSSTVSMKFRTQAGNSIVTPGTAGNYLMTLRLLDGTGALADFDGTTLYVGNLNEVDISAEVDPSLSLSLSSSSCDLGTFSTTTVETCQYNSTVSTNAANGYTAYIRDDGNLQNTNADDIDDVAGGTTAAGSEEYGIATSDTDTVDITAKQSSAECTSLDNGSSPVNALPLTTSDQTYATSTGPVDTDAVTVCHSAAISATTPAGAYTQIVIITAIGNF